MSRGDLCNRCQHIRSAHTTVLGSEDTKCNWPNCTCGRFDESLVSLRTAYAKDRTLDKEPTAYDDLPNVLRLGLKGYNIK